MENSVCRDKPFRNKSRTFAYSNLKSMQIVDAHSHLWLTQEATVEGQRIYQLPNGRAMFFGEERQMLPPFMTDGRNTAEVFLANMNYAQVGASVVVQEVIDGNQDHYLSEVQAKYPDRFICCSLMDPDHQPLILCPTFRGVAIPGHRIHRSLTGSEMMEYFKQLEAEGKFLSMCLADDASQISQMREVIAECPSLKVAIGHFGMPTGKHWKEQVLLAEAPQVFVESGGITWLYNSEFYPYPSAIRAIRQAAEWIGMDKLMWGSDYPRTICAITYRMSYDFVLKSSEFSTEEKENFLGKNAMRFYGIDRLPELPYIKNMSE